MEGYVYLFIFHEVENAGISIDVSPSRLQSHICERFNFKINVKNSVKYLQGINCLQLAVAGKSEINI